MEPYLLHTLVDTLLCGWRFALHPAEYR